MTFSVLILVCSVMVPAPLCQRDTALDVIAGPPAANEWQCGLYGQAYLAETALNERIGTEEYLKVTCTRSSIGKENVG